MAYFLGSMAASYLGNKLGGGGGSTLSQGLSGGSSVGSTLGNLAAGSSGDTLSPHQFGAPPTGVTYYNRRNDQNQRRRMF